MQFNPQLAKNGPVKAKKSLGQNFLTDNLAIDSIVGAIKPKPTDTIVEIGPGHGELTLPLVKSGAKVIAIEKDEYLVSSMKYLVSKHTNLEIISGDALKLLPSFTTQLQPISYKLCGNIPYYITGFLLRTISELEHKPTSIVLTIQKEVAERICARPGKTNLLSASVQFWGKPEIIAIIPRESFNPIPKVDSAVIRITPFEIRNSKLEIKQNFYKFIKILFAHPRKTILNNLRGTLTAEQIKKAGVNPALRPQNISIKDILKIASNSNLKE